MTSAQRIRFAAVGSLLMVTGLLARAGFSDTGQPLPIPHTGPIVVDADLPPGASVPFFGQVRVANLLPVVPLWSKGVEDGSASPKRVPNPMLADPAAADDAGEPYCPKGSDCLGYAPSSN